MEDRSGSGAPIYRYGETKREFDLAFGDGDSIDRINAHIEEHIGPVASVFHEIISDLVHVDIHMVAPTAERNYYTLVTSGMSDRAMNAPEGMEAWRYSELVLCLPHNWPMDQESWKNEAHYWPIRWLKILSRFPHEHNAWLWQWHTVPNGDPAEPLAPGLQLTGVLLMPPLNAPAAFRELHIDAEKTVHFHAMVPLTTDEMQLKLDQGAEALMEGFEKHGITELLVANRGSTLQRNRSWFNFWRKG
jgi:hypothetical protein